MRDYGPWIGYLDETGDPHLAKIDHDYPVFGLSVCLFDKQAYAHQVVPRMLDLKFRWWGHDMVVLHEADIRKRDVPFVFLGDLEKRTAFMDELSAIIAGAPMTLFASVIRKQAYVDEGRDGDLSIQWHCNSSLNASRGNYARPVQAACVSRLQRPGHLSWSLRSEAVRRTPSWNWRSGASVMARTIAANTGPSNSASRPRRQIPPACNWPI